MKRVTLRHLRTFRAVVDCGSFSEAARTLHLTQPAVSLHVKELEHECGLALLERRGRRIRLTDAGHELLRAAHGIERELKQAEDQMAALKGLQAGRLTVAAISTAQYFAPRLLSQFCMRNPNIELHLDVCNRANIIAHLERDDVDAAIMGRPPAELAIDCDAEPFARHPHVAIASPQHPLVRRASIPISEFVTHPFISREPGSGTRQLIQGLVEREGLSFSPAMVMNSNESIKQAVIAGMGVSFLSLHTLGLELRSGMLAPLPVAGTPVVRRWYIVHRHDKRLSPAGQAFRAYMLAEASRIMTSFMPDTLPARRGASAIGSARSR